MAKIKRGSLVLPKGTTADGKKRRQLVDLISKRKVAKRKMKVAGQEAAVFIAKARKAKVEKAALTEGAISANAAARRLKKIATGRKISLAIGNGGGMYINGRTDPMTIKVYGRKSKYTTAQLREIPSLDRASEKLAKLSKARARKSGGLATGIKRTAEAAIGRIATGKAIKATARKAGILGIVGMFMNELNGKKNGRG
jgi:hypothetical protein